MLINLYLCGIAAVIVAVVIAVAGAPGVAYHRTAKTIVFAAAPCLGIGILSGLMLSANGQPKVEWLVPLVGTILIASFCRSDRVFAIARLALPVAALVLCGSFLHLVQFTGRYTAAPWFPRRIAEINQTHFLRSAEERLREKPAGTVLPKERIAVILANDTYDRVPAVALTRMWHTPITRLHQVKHRTVRLWYPGGPVEIAAAQLIPR